MKVVERTKPGSGPHVSPHADGFPFVPAVVEAGNADFAEKPFSKSSLFFNRYAARNSIGSAGLERQSKTND